MDGARGLSDKLRAEGERVAAFFGGLEPDAWSRQVYAESAVWTVRSVLAHLATSERAFLTQLFPKVRAGLGGSSEDFSIDRYNARQQERTGSSEPAELLELYKSTRRDMADWVAGLLPEELDQRGRHPYLGVTSLREMIKMVYLHNKMHLRDVKASFE